MGQTSDRREHEKNKKQDLGLINKLKFWVKIENARLNKVRRMKNFKKLQLKIYLINKALGQSEDKAYENMLKSFCLDLPKVSKKDKLAQEIAKMEALLI